MILPDINVLIYAHNEAARQFERANRWLSELLTGSSRACFCWETINGFVRVSTNTRLDEPLNLSQALLIVRSWLESPNTVLLRQTPRHIDVLAHVATGADARGPIFSDAVLAAIAIEHNVTLATTDRDFARFEGLKVIDPLAS
jgi:toxin-antitoxin system PIN domain toxin